MTPFDKEFFEKRKDSQKEELKKYAKSTRDFALDILSLSLYLEENPDNMTYDDLSTDYLTFIEKELSFYQMLIGLKLYKNSKKLREKAQKMVKNEEINNN